MKIRDVGRSQRTPAKHALMSSIWGREVGVINHSRLHGEIDRLVWLDLTAGDGVPADGFPWAANCSPGINAYHATQSTRPVDVTLYEIQPATFDRLLSSLTDHLPRIGYERDTDTEWRFGDRVHLRAVHESGATADIGHIRRTDAVLVSNDPNAITDWAMRPTLSQEIANRTWCFRTLCTMGCNVGGLLRSKPPVRQQWFELIAQQVSAVPRYRDLLLAAIEGDSSKWAYLLCAPTKWRAFVERDVDSAFGQYGYIMSQAWYRTAPDDFRTLEDQLFLTREERAFMKEVSDHGGA